MERVVILVGLREIGYALPLEQKRLPRSEESQ